MIETTVRATDPSVYEVELRFVDGTPVEVDEVVINGETFLPERVSNKWKDRYLTELEFREEMMQERTEQRNQADQYRDWWQEEKERRQKAEELLAESEGRLQAVSEEAEHYRQGWKWDRVRLDQIQKQKKDDKSDLLQRLDAAKADADYYRLLWKQVEHNYRLALLYNGQVVAELNDLLDKEDAIGE